MLEEYLMLVNPNFIDDYVAWVKNGCKEPEEEASRVFEHKVIETKEEFHFPPETTSQEIVDFVLKGKVPNDVTVEKGIKDKGVKMPGSGKRF